MTHVWAALLNLHYVTAFIFAALYYCLRVTRDYRLRRRLYDATAGLDADALYSHFATPCGSLGSTPLNRFDPSCRIAGPRWRWCSRRFFGSAFLNNRESRFRAAICAREGNLSARPSGMRAVTRLQDQTPTDARFRRRFHRVQIPRPNVRAGRPPLGGLVLARGQGPRGSSAVVACRNQAAPIAP